VDAGPEVDRERRPVDGDGPARDRVEEALLAPAILSMEWQSNSRE